MMIKSELATPQTAPVWLASCPKSACKGTVRAEPGHTVNWVYVCSHCGTAFDLLAESYNVARWRLAEGPHACPEIPWREPRRRSTSSPAPTPTPEEFKVYRRHLRRKVPEALQWLAARGLTEETASHWRWGYGQPDPRRPPGFIIPLPRYRPVSYRIRYWPELWVPPGCEARPVKIASPRGHPQMLWPYVPQGRRTLLCEGEFDAALARQHGISTTATPGMMIKSTLAAALGQSVEAVAVIFDVGPDADAAADRAVGLLREAGAEAWAVRLPLPNQGDDLTDYFLASGSANQLRRLIRKARHDHS